MGLSFVMLAKAGVPSALAFGFNFFEAVAITATGGCLGVFFFVYFWGNVLSALKKRKMEKQKSLTHATKKNFTLQNKILIKVKRRLGLVGITLVTPFFSYPLGCFVAVKYYHRDLKKVIAYMLLSTCIWSVLLCLVKLF